MAQHLGVRLRAARLRAGLSPAATAVASARSTQSLALYERGQVTPPVHVLERLALAFDCEVADFFLDTTEDPSNAAEEADHASR